MSTVGKVETVWRYPVKSMAGEPLAAAFVGYAGVYGDRMYAFVNSAAPAGFPYLTGRNRPEMVLHRPRFRNSALAESPPNQAEAESLGPGLTPLYPAAADLAVDVVTPAGDVFAIDDPALAAALAKKSNDTLSLARSDRAMTDCRPISLISLRTMRQIGEEVGADMDKRRFRANIYADLDGAGFAEDAFAARKLKIGARVVVSVLSRDPRCKMISLDPDTAEENSAVLRTVARGHGGDAGVYCAVLIEGSIRPGDSITLLD